MQTLVEKTKKRTDSKKKKNKTKQNNLNSIFNAQTLKDLVQTSSYIKQALIFRGR